MPFKLVLPLPRFVFHPLTAGTIVAIHIYLAYGHLAMLATGHVEWVHIWEGLRRVVRWIRIRCTLVTPHPYIRAALSASYYWEPLSIMNGITFPPVLCRVIEAFLRRPGRCQPRRPPWPRPVGPPRADL